jgi:ABC-type transport system involved in cytochrome c biogenesis ATPase subunit
VTQLVELLNRHVAQGGVVLYTSHQTVPLGGRGQHYRLPS